MKVWLAVESNGYYSDGGVARSGAFIKVCATRAIAERILNDMIEDVVQQCYDGYDNDELKEIMDEAKHDRELFVNNYEESYHWDIIESGVVE